MTAPVNPTPLLPLVPSLPDEAGLARFVPDLIQALYRELTAYAFRLNGSLSKDGSEPMAAPLPAARFTVATLPSASANTGGFIFVSNGTANKRLAISDGTNWRWPDGQIVT